jgi:hypothetical protein
MNDSERQLEKQRAALLKQIGSVEDLRRGSITQPLASAESQLATVPNLTILATADTQNPEAAVAAVVGTKKLAFRGRTL